MKELYRDFSFSAYYVYSECDRTRPKRPQHVLEFRCWQWGPWSKIQAPGVQALPCLLPSQRPVISVTPARVPFLTPSQLRETLAVGATEWGDVSRSVKASRGFCCLLFLHQDEAFHLAMLQEDKSHSFLYNLLFHLRHRWVSIYNGVFLNNTLATLGNLPLLETCFGGEVGTKALLERVQDRMGSQETETGL